MSVDVDVNIGEVLCEMSDEDILEEAKGRNLTITLNEPTDTDLVRDAYEELARGRVAEAKFILESMLFPKWKTSEACKQAWESATGKKAN